MTDEVPDYPPGPRGPEESGVPGPRLRLSPGQIRFIAAYVRKVEGASVVEIEERGSGYFMLTVLDGDRARLAGRMIYPLPGPDEWASPQPEDH